MNRKEEYISPSEEFVYVDADICRMASSRPTDPGQQKDPDAGGGDDGDDGEEMPD